MVISSKVTKYTFKYMGRDWYYEEEKRNRIVYYLNDLPSYLNYIYSHQICVMFLFTSPAAIRNIGIKRMKQGRCSVPSSHHFNIQSLSFTWDGRFMHYLEAFRPFFVRNGAVKLTLPAKLVGGLCFLQRLYYQYMEKGGPWGSLRRHKVSKEVKDLWKFNFFLFLK